MADLSVKYCGVTYQNPLILASATPGWDGNAMLLAAKQGIGGVIPKTIGPEQKWAKHPRNGRFYIYKKKNIPIGQVNLELFTTKTRGDWLDHDLEIAKQGRAVMHISLLAMPEPEQTAALVEEIQSTGLADILELNVSCPMPAKTVGMHIGKSAEKTFAQVKAAKETAKIPLTVKLTPNVASMIEIAQAAKEAGADGITISNSIRAFAGVDIEIGKPYLCAYGGYTGPAIKPIIMRHVSEVAKQVDIPISAVGGVSSYRDVIEYIMLGAVTVQLCTSVMWQGYALISKILSDLNGWMEEKGYTSFEDIRGMALGNITSVEELARLPAKHAVIDAASCIQCGICRRVCFYRAITDLYRVRYDQCDGCGACEQWCPKKAVTLC